jgi:xanthine/CO dehydrogenase XdhC/CoxF family maturation factor
MCDHRTVSEITDVLQAIESLSAKGERMALATIVAVRGSTYRRPGARLLVPEDGAPIGNISGGCLEGDVADMARIVMDEGTARLAGWDLTADDDAVWGLGLGCNGAIEVFIEPVDAPVCAALLGALERGERCCLATVVSSTSAELPAGSHALVTAYGPMGDGSALLRDHAVAALAAGDGRLRSVRLPDGEARIFSEVLQPPPRLLVCGAGHDAIPLVRDAAAMGWRVTVTDPRRGLLEHGRFPEAEAFIPAHPVDGVTEFEPVSDDFVLVMSHNYLKDLEYLRALVDVPLAYLGQLGPRRRTQQLLRELDRNEAIDQIHAPAGLDIGAEGPEEVAWAVVAEMLAVRRKRPAGFLRDRRAPIHAVEAE